MCKHRPLYIGCSIYRHCLIRQVIPTQNRRISDICPAANRGRRLRVSRPDPRVRRGWEQGGAVCTLRDSTNPSHPWTHRHERIVSHFLPQRQHSQVPDPSPQAKDIPILGALGAFWESASGLWSRHRFTSGLRPVRRERGAGAGRGCHKSGVSMPFGTSGCTYLLTF